MYWLPGISVAQLAAVKLLLVGSAVLTVFIVVADARHVRLPKGLLGPAGVILMLFVGAPGLFQAATAGHAFGRVLDTVLGFTFMWALYNYVRRGGDAKRVFIGAALIISALSILTILNLTAGFPTWRAPFGAGRLPLHITGFGAGRTGWSNGIALNLPTAVLFLSRARMRRFPVGRILTFILILVSIVGSQIVCGGRAGLVASLLVIAAFALTGSSRSMAAVAIVTTVLVAFFLSDFLFEQLRINRLATAVVSVDTIDKFSAGRVRGYIVALDLIGQSPFIGHGIGQVSLQQYGLGYPDIHNIWLKMAVESGIALPVFVFLIICAVLAKALALAKQLRGKDLERDDRLFMLALILIVFVGVVLSFFEPNVLIGTFQNSAIWWAAAGTILGYRANIAKA